MNYEYLQAVMTRAGIPAQDVQTLTDTAHALDDNIKGMMDGFLAEYRKDTDFNFQEALKLLLEAAPAEQGHALQLIFSFLLTEHTELLYQRRGLSVELFENMLLDLKTKNEECHRYYGHAGSFVAAWFYRWFSLQRIAFERLQMEVRKLGTEYRTLKADSLAINVHIPAIGPLDHDACLRDYHRAAAFFAEEFKGQDIAFMCHSWLLHPAHPDFLPPTSRLLAFQADFDIVRFDEDPEGKDLWRLYGVPFDGNPDHLSERNSLERAYKSFLQNGGVSGEGLGIFLYDEIKDRA